MLIIKKIILEDLIAYKTAIGKQKIELEAQIKYFLFIGIAFDDKLTLKPHFQKFAPHFLSGRGL